MLFRVYGLPQPGGSKRAFKNPKTERIVVVDDNPKAKSWQGLVAEKAVEAMGSGEPLSGPLSVRLTFIMPRLKGHYGTGRNAGVLKPTAPFWHMVRPDASKLARSTIDAMTGIVYRDDAQIAEELHIKVYGDRPGVEVEVERPGAIDARALEVERGMSLLSSAA